MNNFYENVFYTHAAAALCKFTNWFYLNLINYTEIWHFTCNGLVLQVQGADALTHNDQNDDEMKHPKDRQG